MNNETAQAIEYIKNQLQQGASKESIRQSLMQSGWGEVSIQQAFDGVENLSLHAASSEPKKSSVLVGVLWILSSIIVLSVVLTLNIIVRFTGISSQVINIISILLGMVGVILIPLGPIIGVVKLVRRT